MSSIRRYLVTILIAMLTLTSFMAALQSYRGERINVELGEALSQSLKQLAQRQAPLARPGSARDPDPDY